MEKKSILNTFNSKAFARLSSVLFDEVCIAPLVEFVDFLLILKSTITSPQVVVREAHHALSLFVDSSSPRGPPSFI